MRRLIYETSEAMKIALSAIWANKARGVLTTLGIVIGIVAVVATMTAANGLENSFKESISAVGSDVVYVSRMPWIIMDDFFKYRNRQPLTLKDAKKLETRLASARAINPTTSTRRDIKYRSAKMEGVRAVGTTDKHIMVTTALPEYGRFLNSIDVQYKRNVCVIGKEIQERLFKDINPLNKKIRIGRYNYRVVGVMEKQGSAGFFNGPNFDRQVFVPITSFMKNYGSRNRDFDIAVKAPSQEAMVDFEYAVIGEMRNIRKLRPTEDDNFSVNQMTTLMNAYDNVMGNMVLIGLLITSVSLFIGGIGVMNIMFVSVTERTREIGIRKAIGAKKRAIMIQFLFEASVVCLIGGTLGVLASIGVTELINAFFLPASLSPGIVVVALVVSAATGIIAGFIPAVKAARLNPIEALRYE